MSNEDRVKLLEDRLQQTSKAFQRLLEISINEIDTPGKKLAQFQIEENEELLNDSSYKNKASKQ
jgi:hypothetical protein